MSFKIRPATLAATSLAFASAWIVAPAHAQYGTKLTNTGAACFSDSPTVVTVLGTLENWGVKPSVTAGGISSANAKDFATFDCPIALPVYDDSVNKRVAVLVIGPKTTRTDKVSTCTLTVSHPSMPGSYVQTGAANLPALTASDSAPSYSAYISLALPPQVFGVGGVAHLRCRLYNTDSGPRGGVTGFAVHFPPVQ